MKDFYEINILYMVGHDWKMLHVMLNCNKYVHILLDYDNWHLRGINLFSKGGGNSVYCLNSFLKRGLL